MHSAKNGLVRVKEETEREENSDVVAPEEKENHGDVAKMIQASVDAAPPGGSFPYLSRKMRKGLPLKYIERN